MPLPNNRIKKIKLPNNQTYEIIPEKLQSNGYQVQLPTILQDDEVILSNATQSINGNKSFDGAVRLINRPLIIQADNSTAYTGDDWDASFYPDKVEINVFSDEDESTFTLRYPELGEGETKTFATTSDLTEIVDLTQINNNN